MAKIVALANQKGGVGKTTTAINLSAALGVLEKRVLLVDCDPQGNATRGVGIEAEDPHLYHVLAGQGTASSAIQQTDFAGLSLLPTNRELVGFEVEFVGIEDWQSKLRVSLEAVQHEYDYILLDCPPSLGILTVNALAAADKIVVPLQCEYFALEGISELVTTVQRVQGNLNPKLLIDGIVLTMYDERTNLAQDVAAEAQRFFGGKVYQTKVPRNIRLAEAPSHRLPIFQYDIKSRGATAYLEVAREFLRREAMA